MPIWYWRQESFKGLADLCGIMESDASLSDFAGYLRMRECGRRKAAFSRLDAFLQTAARWPFERRREFVDWLMSAHDQHPEIVELIPYPLHVGLVKPTIDEWIKAEPHSAVPYRWRGEADDLRRALQLDPSEQIARRRLLGILVDDYPIHELQNGGGYIGSPRDDLLLLEEAGQLVRGLNDAKLKASYIEEINLLQEITRSYVDFRASGAVGTYEQWATENQRPIRTRIWKAYDYGA